MQEKIDEIESIKRRYFIKLISEFKYTYNTVDMDADYLIRCVVDIEDDIEKMTKWTEELTT